MISLREFVCVRETLYIVYFHVFDFNVDRDLRMQQDRM